MFQKKKKCLLFSDLTSGSLADSTVLLPGEETVLYSQPAQASTLPRDAAYSSPVANRGGPFLLCWSTVNHLRGREVMFWLAHVWLSVFKMTQAIRSLSRDVTCHVIWPFLGPIRTQSQSRCRSAVFLSVLICLKPVRNCLFTGFLSTKRQRMDGCNWLKTIPHEMS